MTRRWLPLLLLLTCALPVHAAAGEVNLLPSAPLDALVSYGSPELQPESSPTDDLFIGGDGQAHQRWFVRVDGLPRAGFADTADGLADAACVVGGGQNQHCAFSEYRWLWFNNSYNNRQWVIQGGDQVVVRGCHGQDTQQGRTDPGCRVGADTPHANGADGTVCWDCGQPLENPAIPAGTEQQHTSILSGCAYDGDCGSGWIWGDSVHTNNTNSRLVELHGGYGVGTVLDLGSTQWVDVAGFELTDHAECGKSTGQGPTCASFPPANDDFTNSGINLNNSSKHLSLRDMNIHGVAHAGIQGSIGGLTTNGVSEDGIQFLRVSISTNAHAGWDLDDGVGSTAGLITQDQVYIQHSGCIEKYPLVGNPSIRVCYDQNTSGYGDAIGTYGGDQARWLLKNSVYRGNMQDGPDLAHSTNGYMKAYNIQSYANQGAAYKPGGTLNTVLVDSFIMGNCNFALDASTFPDAPAGWNAGATGCRIGDIVPFNWSGAGHTTQIEHNTFVVGGTVMFDIGCLDQTNGCAAGTKILRNNAFVFYADHGWNVDQVPAVFCYTACNTNPPYPAYLSDDSQWTDRSNNIYYQPRNCPSPLRANETCALDPGWSKRIMSQMATHATFQWSAFDFRLTGSSALRSAGIVGALSPATDFAGNLWASTPAIGALEYGSSYGVPVYSGGGTPPATALRRFGGAVRINGRVQ